MRKVDMSLKNRNMIFQKLVSEGFPEDDTTSQSSDVVYSLKSAVLSNIELDQEDLDSRCLRIFSFISTANSASRFADPAISALNFAS